MINNPTALLQPGDHAADKNRTTTATGDKVWAGVAESFGLGADPVPGLSHQGDVDVCSGSTIAQDEGGTQERGPQDRKFQSQAELTLACAWSILLRTL